MEVFGSLEPAGGPVIDPMLNAREDDFDSSE